MHKSIWVLALTWALASGGCGGGGGDDDGGVESQSRAARLAQEWVAEWDRSAAANCTCQVASGAYATMEECMAAYGAGPDWAQCLVTVLEGADAGDVLAQGRCLIDELSAQGACLEAAECDPVATGTCFQMEGQCMTPDNDLVLRVLELCPDFGLLSR